MDYWRKYFSSTKFSSNFLKDLIPSKHYQDNTVAKLHIHCYFCQNRNFHFWLDIRPRILYFYIENHRDVELGDKNSTDKAGIPLLKPCLVIGKEWESCQQFFVIKATLMNACSQPWTIRLGVLFTKSISMTNKLEVNIRTWWHHQMKTFSALLAICEGNHRSPVDSPHKGRWRRALLFSFICAWTNGWANNRDASDWDAFALIMTTL